jgi:hypothetical protein
MGRPLRPGWRLATGLLIVSGALAVLGVLAWVRLTGRRTSHPHGPEENKAQHRTPIEDVTDRTQVKEITASIPDLRTSMGFSGPPVPEFVIPAKYVPVILKALTPAERHEYPRPWDDIVLCRITITTKSGSTIPVAVCFAGKSPLCYSVGGVQYMRGGPYRPVYVDEEGGGYKDEGCLLHVIIREIHQEQNGNRPRELTDFIDLLERSIGEKPPRAPKKE